MRTILRTIEVRCPFTATMTFAERCCRELPARRLEAKGIRDRTDRARRNTALSVEFVPQSRVPWPALKLRVTARPWHGGSRIHVEATYVAPFGLIGRTADAVAGRHLAARTIDQFLRNLCAAVEQTWKRERDAWTPPAAEPRGTTPSLTPV